MMMCHTYIRSILALIWLAAAIISDVEGDLAGSGLCILTGIVFGCTAYTF